MRNEIQKIYDSIPRNWKDGTLSVRAWTNAEVARAESSLILMPPAILHKPRSRYIRRYKEFIGRHHYETDRDRKVDLTISLILDWVAMREESKLEYEERFETRLQMLVDEAAFYGELKAWKFLKNNPSAIETDAMVAFIDTPEHKEKINALQMEILKNYKDAKGESDE
jgi:hypothetical protein